MRNASLNHDQELEMEIEYSESEFQEIEYSDDYETSEDDYELDKADFQLGMDLEFEHEYIDSDNDNFKPNTNIYPYHFKKFANKYRLKYIEHELLNGFQKGKQIDTGNENDESENEQDGVMVNIIFPANPNRDGNFSLEAHFEYSEKPKGTNILSYLIFHCDEYSLPLRINTIDELTTWCKESKLV